MSRSSVKCGQGVAIFKHNEIFLSSIQNFWPGNVGYQQQPCVTAIGAAAVFLASGCSPHNWSSSSGDNLNGNLPYVEQKGNLALLMYRPESRLTNLGYSITDLEIHWQENLFDEVLTDSVWLIDRQGQNFVAVSRNCNGDDTATYCSLQRGQTWAILAGDSLIYNGFQNFKDVVHQSQLEENWFIDTGNNLGVYHAKIALNTLTIEHNWTIDTALTTSVNELETTGFKIYPNPAESVITVEADIAIQALLPFSFLI